MWCDLLISVITPVYPVFFYSSHPSQQNSLTPSVRTSNSGLLVSTLYARVNFYIRINCTYFIFFFLTSHKWVWVAYAGGWVSLPHSLSVSIFQSCISCGGRWTHYMFIHSNGNVISSIFAAFIIFRPYSIPASMETRACTLHPSLPLSQPCRLHQSPAPLPLWLLHRCP